MLDNSYSHERGNWTLIWRWKIPHKMKVFLWRVARWCLSTRGKLIRKGVECPIYCSFCVECDENDWHIFVGCEQVAKVWQEASLKHQVDDTREFIFTALQQFSYPKIEVFVFAMWTQWKHHNQSMHATIHTTSIWLAKSSTKLQCFLRSRFSILSSLEFSPIWLCQMQCRCVNFSRTPIAWNDSLYKRLEGQLYLSNDFLFFEDPNPLEDEARALSNALSWISSREHNN